LYALCPEIVDLAFQELDRLDPRHAVQRAHLVETAVDRALGRRAVVADDQVDQRILEDAEVLQRRDQPADFMIRLLHEPGIDLHLPRQHGLEVRGHRIPRRDLVMSLGELRILRDHAQNLLPCERLLAPLVPAAVELALVLVHHNFGTWCGACVAPGAKYMTKGLSGISAFCWRIQRMP
jgi:hypothetical protein